MWAGIFSLFLIPGVKTKLYFIFLGMNVLLAVWIVKPKLLEVYIMKW